MMFGKVQRLTVAEVQRGHRRAFARYIWGDLCREIGLNENSGIADRCTDLVLRRMEWCEKDWPKVLQERQESAFPPRPDPV